MKWKCESGSEKDTELYRKQKIKEQFYDDQPERSKREDCKCPILSRYTLSGVYQGEYKRCRCGALNSMET